jgi:hypothetical protein
VARVSSKEKRRDVQPTQTSERCHSTPLKAPASGNDGRRGSCNEHNRTSLIETACGTLSSIAPSRTGPLVAAPGRREAGAVRAHYMAVKSVAFRRFPTRSLRMAYAYGLGQASLNAGRVSMRLAGAGTHRAPVRAPQAAAAAGAVWRRIETGVCETTATIFTSGAASIRDPQNL